MCVQCEEYVWAINVPSIQKTHIRIRTLQHQRWTDEFIVSRTEYNKNEIRHTHTHSAAPSIFLATHIHWFGDNAFSVYWFWLRETGDPSRTLRAVHRSHFYRQATKWSANKPKIIIFIGPLLCTTWASSFYFYFHYGWTYCTNVEYFGPHKHLTSSALWIRAYTQNYFHFS